MANGPYTPLGSSKDVVLNTLLPVDVQGQSPLKPTQIGLPDSKQYITRMDGLVAATSVVSLALAIAVVWVDPIAVYLGQKFQLVLLGLLLSFMSQCTQRFASLLFLLVEARFGPSSLQNYDAILRNSFMLPHTSFAWRAVLTVLMALPLGLSAAYKQFIGGSVSAVRPSEGGFHGVTGPPGLQHLGFGAALMINATTPFLENMQNKSYTPTYPAVYGFNLIALSEESTALLDGPLPSHIRSIQSRMGADETITMTAVVNATVSHQNKTVDHYRDDADFWTSYNISSQLESTSSLSGANFGVLTGNLAHPDYSWAFISKYEDDSTHDTFNSSALGFDIRRERCNASWQMDRYTIQLVSAKCLASSLQDVKDQAVLTNNQLAIGTWYPDLLFEALANCDWSIDDRKTVSTSATLAAAMVWSRLVALDGPTRAALASEDLSSNPDWHGTLIYQAEDHIRYTVVTLRQRRTLIAVLAIQPIIMILMAIACVMFHSVPISDGFGVIAILAGIKPDSLDVVKGAALTGHVSSPVTLDILVEDGRNEELGTGHISYVTQKFGRGRRRRLRLSASRIYC